MKHAGLIKEHCRRNLRMADARLRHSFNLDALVIEGRFGFARLVPDSAMNAEFIVTSQDMVEAGDRRRLKRRLRKGQAGQLQFVLPLIAQKMLADFRAELLGDIERGAFP